MITHGRHDFRALGTGCVLLATDAEALPTALSAVTAELDAVDASCSRFRDDSDLSRVNRAGGRPTKVSADLLAGLEGALRAARLTGGDLDPTIGAAIVALGYSHDFARMGMSVPGSVTVRRIPGWEHIVIDPEHATVTVPDGVSLDLGATAKAWAADRAAKAAADATGCGVLISLGGDIATHGAAPDAGWTIRIADDHAAPPDGCGPLITIRDGAIATSSTSVRRWSRDGHQLHHILDPATSMPAPEVWRTVSVAAASALDANIAATTSIVRGERAIDWLATFGLPARLVRSDGLVLAVHGWPPEPTAASCR